MSTNPRIEFMVWVMGGWMKKSSAKKGRPNIFIPTGRFFNAFDHSAKSKYSTGLIAYFSPKLPSRLNEARNIKDKQIKIPKQIVIFSLLFYCKCASFIMALQKR